MSYYPLDLWIREDGGVPVDFHFYHAPLGVDASIFTLPPVGSHRDILVCTSGFQRNQESVAECDEAAVSLDGRIFQLGPHLDRMKSQVSYATGITDEELARWYRQCQWVSGLRRHEGFELPAAEGLLCGARPLLYDRPHYRHWFDGWAEFVPEEPHDLVVENLKRLFARGPKRVSEEEREFAARRFNWEQIVREFWGRCGA
jgi:glycosyltransferase involved in cell wall biosynthesis